LDLQFQVIGAASLTWTRRAQAILDVTHTNPGRTAAEIVNAMIAVSGEGVAPGGADWVGARKPLRRGETMLITTGPGMTAAKGKIREAARHSAGIFRAI
jgi:hypothetical protein